MQQQGLRRTALFCLWVALATGCTDSGGDAPSAPSAEASAQEVSADAVSAKGRAAEEVKSVLEVRISEGERRFGTGTGSPCSTSSSRMFTEECGEAATATSDAAALALTEIDGRDGFATLDSAAHDIQTAVRSYQELGCASAPTAELTRQACLDPAAVIAQGFPDLRGGANLALAGK
jgi:hypothetical protein